MSDITLGTLIALIRSSRSTREQHFQRLEQDVAHHRPAWRVQMDAADWEYRQQLAAISEVPSLLSAFAFLGENWPYPSEQTLEQFRIEVAQLTLRPLILVDSMPLQQILTCLAKRALEPVHTNGATDEVRIRHEEIDVAKLPRWGQLAYVARCLRLVLRLLTRFPISDAALTTFERAVENVENSARLGRVDPMREEVAQEVIAWSNVAMSNNRIAEQLLHLVGSGISALLRACSQSDLQAAQQAFQSARRAAVLIDSGLTLRLMELTWAHMLRRAKSEKWTEETRLTPEQLPIPRLRLVGLHLRSLRAITKLQLPADGLGWNGAMPDTLLIGGINGTGKSTLLEFLCEALNLLSRPPQIGPFPLIPAALCALEAWADFEIESFEVPRQRIRFLVGNDDFFQQHCGEAFWGFRRINPEQGFYLEHGFDSLSAAIRFAFTAGTIPSVVHISSENRNLLTPEEQYKAAGKRLNSVEFIHRWERPTRWHDSLEAWLYSLRWQDLNAKEELRFADTGQFQVFADAFAQFSQGAKSLAWEKGELVVRLTNSQARHDFARLSSGEKQVMLLCGELLQYWRPGSLILLDEPELHLHALWQTKLWQALQNWQRERGGQIILTTQSNHLFELAQPGQAVILGSGALV
jgi:predicted ATPase